MSLINHLTSLSQLRTLLDAKKDKLVVIDFHATWCGPCHAIAPKYEQLSQQYKGVATFCKVDVDAAKEIAVEYSVRAMPTFVFIKGGSKVDEVKGANAKAIEAALLKHAGAGSSTASSFPGSGHTLAGQTVAPPSASSQLPDFKTLFILIALVGLWWYYGKNSEGKVDLPPDGEGFF